jgi:Xaa-Pro aminopeptidase
MRSPMLIAAGSLALAVGCAAPAPTQSPAPARGGAVVDRWQMPPLPPATPIAREEYQARRAALAARMDDGVLVVLGAEEPAEDYLPYAQQVNFRYLTGIVEPGAALVVEKVDGVVAERLFVAPRDPAREVWDGVRLGTAGAAELTGIPARPAAALPTLLDSVAARAARLYILGPVPSSQALLDVLTPEQQLVSRLAARYPRLQALSLQDAVTRLRAAKSPAEIDRIRRAVYITALAERAAMQSMEPALNEFEIEALIEYTFRRNGAEGPSFSTIVGSGPNSTTLHYVADDRQIVAGETVVMDIGASYDGYAADVTRTVPASGQFTPEQRAVYEVVLAAQKAAEPHVRVGGTMREFNQAAEVVLAAGLARLGLIDAPDATYQCGTSGEICPQFRLFYMHGLGHGIGLEVHDPDVSSYGGFRVGSVITIEPGIYVRADVLDHLPATVENQAMIARLRPAVERYRNIGVRIEDDFLLTQTGPEWLSSGAPREIAEIEALMRLPSVVGTERRGEVVDWYRSMQGR